MKKLTIREMAKLRGLTVDTLRHYDHVGLFKPAYVDPDTGYRYYSILQYEVLGTIKELRQVGMPIEEIKQFMTGRNVKQSVAFIERSIADIQDQIERLQHIAGTLSGRLTQIEQFEQSYRDAAIVVKQFEQRECISLSRIVNVEDPEMLSYGLLELEQKIQGTVPILASNRFGDWITKDQMESLRQGGTDGYQERSFREFDLFIIVQDDTPVEQTRTIPEGLYLCSYYGGLQWQSRLACLQSLLQYCDEHRLEIIGDALHVIQIDISLTDKIEEACYEIQIPIRSSSH